MRKVMALYVWVRLSKSVRTARAASVPSKSISGKTVGNTVSLPTVAPETQRNCFKNSSNKYLVRQLLCYGFRMPTRKIANHVRELLNTGACSGLQDWGHVAPLQFTVHEFTSSKILGKQLVGMANPVVGSTASKRPITLHWKNAEYHFQPRNTRLASAHALRIYRLFCWLTSR